MLPWKAAQKRVCSGDFAQPVIEHRFLRQEVSGIRRCFYFRNMAYDLHTWDIKALDVVRRLERCKRSCHSLEKFCLAISL